MAYRSTSRPGALIFVLAVAGCGSQTDPASPPATAFRFFTSDAGGAARSTFASLDDAFLTAGGALEVAPGDYYFSIAYDVCLPGPDTYVPQRSRIPCRTFRVGPNGEIVQGSTTACAHAITSTDGGLAIGLMPFEVHPAACGTFRAHVIPLDLPELASNAVASLSFSAP